MQRLLLIIALCTPLLANSAQVTLQWDPPADKAGIVGYFAGCGPAAGNNGTPTKAPGANTATITLTLAPGNWFCAVWAYGAPDTLISTKTNEVQVPVPLGAPGNLRYNVVLAVWDNVLNKYVSYTTVAIDLEPESLPAALDPASAVRRAQ